MIRALELCLIAFWNPSRRASSQDGTAKDAKVAKDAVDEQFVPSRTLRPLRFNLIWYFSTAEFAEFAENRVVTI